MLRDWHRCIPTSGACESLEHDEAVRYLATSDVSGGLISIGLDDTNGEWAEHTCLQLIERPEAQPLRILSPRPMSMRAERKIRSAIKTARLRRFLWPAFLYVTARNRLDARP